MQKLRNLRQKYALLFEYFKSVSLENGYKYIFPQNAGIFGSTKRGDRTQMGRSRPNISPKLEPIPRNNSYQAYNLQRMQEEYSLVLMSISSTVIYLHVYGNGCVCTDEFQSSADVREVPEAQK